MAEQIRKKTVVAAALEAALGVAESLAATDAQFVAYDYAATIAAEAEQRDAPGTLSKLESEIGPRSIEMTFKVELHGSGTIDTNPDWADVFLPACGLTDTGEENIFRVLSALPLLAVTTNRTITIAGYQDGRKIAAAGCMGNVKFVFPNGKKAYAEFTFTGKYEAVTDATLLAPTLPSVTPPRAANLTFTFADAIPGKTNQVEINLQNEVSLREDISPGGASAGYCYASIVDRNPMVTASVESQLVATNDLTGKMLAQTLEAFILKIGGATWNALQFDAPKAQIVGIAYGEREGLNTDDVTWELKRNSANDDEMTLTFSAS